MFSNWVAGGNGGLVGRDGGRHAVLAADAAAVGRGVPRHDQRDICTAVVALSVAVCVHMIRVFIGGRLADRAGFGSLVLCFAGA